MLAGKRVRLWGIDAPEMDSRDGLYARTALDAVLDGAPVRCWRVTTERHKRMIAVCKTGTDPADLSASMVYAGWAWSDRLHAGTRFDFAEVIARKNCRGVWAGWTECQ